MKAAARERCPEKHKTSNLLHWVEKRKQDDKNEGLTILSNGEGLFHRQATQKLLAHAFIFAKMIGISSSSRNISDFVCEPFLVDKYSCAYILKHKLLEIEETNQDGLAQLQKLQQSWIYLAYEYLIREKQLFLVDGHKFGGHFLAYEQNPDSNHASYLVFVAGEKPGTPMDHVSRLAGICKKQALLVNVGFGPEGVPLISHEEIEPKLVHESRKNVTNNSSTPQVLELKKLLGFKF